MREAADLLAEARTKYPADGALRELAHSVEERLLYDTSLRSLLAGARESMSAARYEEAVNLLAERKEFIAEAEVRTLLDSRFRACRGRNREATRCHQT